MKIDIKYYLLRTFAVIGAVVTLSMITGALVTWSWLKSGGQEPPKEPKEIILALDFTAPIGEKIKDFRFSIPDLLEDKHETPLLSITRAIEWAKDDPKVKGIIAKFDTTQPSLVHVQTISKALLEFRKSGKFSYAFSTSYGNFTQKGNSYILASYFDNILLQPVGTVGLSNVTVEAPFGKTALGKLGIKANFLRRAEYKGAMESFTRDSFSPEVKSNMESLLTDLNAQKTNLLAQGLKVSSKKAAELISNGPYTANEAITNKLVTKLAYEDDVIAEAKKMAGKGSELLFPTNYLYYKNRNIKDEDIKSEIALIYAEGTISDDPMKDPSRFSGDGIIDTDRIVQAFETAAKDEKIKAILFRVNSPGGSPVASETIRHALVKAKESKKPIYVSLGKFAASGGYWIAMNGDKIIADEASITGSIGVLAGKIVLGGLFEKLGVKWDSLNIPGSKNAMFSINKPFDKHGAERINAMLDDTYKAFTQHVVAARKIDPSKIDNIAKGRVYTGKQALKVGLVDQLGTLSDALVLLKKDIGIEKDEIVLLHQLPAPETPETLFLKMLTNIQTGGAMVSEFTYHWKQIMAVLSPLLAQAGTQGQAHAFLPMSFQGLD